MGHARSFVSHTYSYEQLIINNPTAPQRRVRLFRVGDGDGAVVIVTPLPRHFSPAKFRRGEIDEINGRSQRPTHEAAWTARLGGWLAYVPNYNPRTCMPGRLNAHRMLPLILLRAHTGRSERPHILMVSILQKNTTQYGCEIEDFVETHLCQAVRDIVLRSRRVAGCVCPHSRYRSATRLPLELQCSLYQGQRAMLINPCTETKYL